MSRLNTPSRHFIGLRALEKTRPRPTISMSTTGAPTKLNTALRGTPANRTTKSARSATVAPVKTTGNNMAAWRPLHPAALTRCGVAKPRKATGPHQAVTKAAKTPADPKALHDKAFSSTPIVFAVNAPMVHMSRLLLALQDQSTAGVKAQHDGARGPPSVGKGPHTPMNKRLQCSRLSSCLQHRDQVPQPDTPPSIQK